MKAQIKQQSITLNNLKIKQMDYCEVCLKILFQPASISEIYIRQCKGDYTAYWNR